MSINDSASLSPDEHKHTADIKQKQSIEKSTFLSRLYKKIGIQNVILIVAIIILIIGIGTANHNFFRLSNISMIGQSVAIMGILSIVQMVVIIMGGIDMTVGSVAGLCSVASAMLFMRFNNAGLAILLTLILGIICGLITASVVVFGRVPPMVATLAGLMAYQGVAQVISDGRAQGYTGSNSVFTFLAQGTVLYIPALIWILILVCLFVHILLRYAIAGRNIFAVGGNDAAARLSGINVNHIIIGCFALSGFIAALAGILLTARTGTGQPVSGSDVLMFQSVTAAALGGVAFRGGKGSVGGTVLAVILLGILLNGMSLLGINAFWQNVAEGVMLLAAVIPQQLRAGLQPVGLPK